MQLPRRVLHSVVWGAWYYLNYFIQSRSFLVVGEGQRSLGKRTNELYVTLGVTGLG